jgi:hypothetical protein
MKEKTITAVTKDIIQCTQIVKRGGTKNSTYQVFVSKGSTLKMSLAALLPWMQLFFHSAQAYTRSR